VYVFDARATLSRVADKHFYMRESVRVSLSILRSLCVVRPGRHIPPLSAG